MLPLARHAMLLPLLHYSDYDITLRFSPLSRFFLLPLMLLLFS